MAEEKITAAPPLTPARIEAFKPRGDRYEVADTAAPGLRLRVMPSGVKSFRWYVSSIGKVITIGPWAQKPAPGHVTLGEARRWLERLKQAHKEGRLDEVTAELRQLRPVRSGKPADSAGNEPAKVKDVADDFLKYVERRRRRPEQARRPIEYDIVPAIGERPITSITARDCRQIVEAVVARGSPTQAGAVLAVLKQLFKFAQGRDDVTQNPALPLDAAMLGVVKNKSQRFLSAKEIPEFWNALDGSGMTPTVRNGLRLLLLLGVRSGELLKATWDEIDLDAATWTVPVAHQKLTLRREQTARPFVVPLPPLAIDILKELHGLAKSIHSNYVMASFHGDGEQTTEKALNHAMRRLFTGEKPRLSFPGERPTPHDLRRTVRTHLGDTLGVAPHIAERCLNHTLGTIATTYDVGDYVAERRAALERWDAYVERLIAPGKAKVAFLATARGAR